MRRDQRIHWIFYTVGVLCLAVGVFGMRPLAIIAIPLLFIAAAFHRRWHRRYGATPPLGTESMNPRISSRPGLYDRYEGIVTSLTDWED